MDNINVLNFSGLSLSEKSFGKVHHLEKSVSSYGEESYKFRGHLHKGEVKFFYENDLKNAVPVVGSGDYGYTLEGVAKNIFYSTDALVTENKSENRTFIYINEKSKLFYGGSNISDYTIYFRVFKDEAHPEIIKWISIYAEPLVGHREFSSQNFR